MSPCSSKGCQNWRSKKRWKTCKPVQACLLGHLCLSKDPSILQQLFRNQSSLLYILYVIYSFSELSLCKSSMNSRLEQSTFRESAWRGRGLMRMPCRTIDLLLAKGRAGIVQHYLAATRCAHTVVQRAGHFVMLEQFGSMVTQGTNKLMSETKNVNDSQCSLKLYFVELFRNESNIIW